MATNTPRRSRSSTGASPAGDAALDKSEYERIATFRHSLRQLARQTELEAREAGTTPQQYQLLLAIKGYPGRDWASISELAERLQIRHNAVIGLVNRAESRNLVRRVTDADLTDRRIVQIHLQPEGEILLRAMASALESERARVVMAIDELEHGG